MFRRWKFFLIPLAIILAAIFGLAMCDPFYRQLAFGPKYDGVPLVTWQEFYREWDNADALKSIRAPNTFDNIHEALVASPSPEKWKKLSGEDRRGILLTLRSDPDVVVRMHVAAHLGDVPTSPEVVAALTSLLGSKDDRVRAYALDSASRLKPPPMELFPKAVEQLNTGNVLDRWKTASVVARFASHEPQTVLPVLLKRLDEGDTTERIGTMEVLRLVSPAPKEAILLIIAQLKHSRPEVRKSALTTLGYLKAEEAIPDIVAALNDPDMDVRNSATYAVANLGAPAKAAVPILRDHLRSADAKRIYFNVPAIKALGNIGKDARSAIPELLRFRDHEITEVRRDVQKALFQIDPEKYPLQPAK